jgi:cyclopropane-fatty-acyl-phospholipid synthase
MILRDRAQALLRPAGITINGTNPWDIQVHDDRLYSRIFSGGSVGLGESYMDGWWDAGNLSEFFFRLLRADVDVPNLRSFGYFLQARFLNMQTRRRATEVVEGHYDIGNELYERMLDPYLQYTCGYWKQATSLAEAQEAKLDLICRKIGLKKGDRVLDIGCGWGGFALYAARHYGASVVGLTISEEQAVFARKLTEGFPIEIRIQDYRDTTDGPYDKIVSVGMFEHVGYKNYRSFMKVVHGLLAQDGLFLLHTIGSHKTVRMGNPWFDKYIFPNGMLPSVAQVGTAINKFFIVEDWHNFGPDYTLTLNAWYTNFVRAWPELQKIDSKKYNERFFRMWEFYLLCMAGAFKARRNQLWQVVLSKKGIVGGYKSVR